LTVLFYVILILPFTIKKSKLKTNPCFYQNKTNRISSFFSLNAEILSDIMGMILNKKVLKGVVFFEGKS